ncbi:MAG: hypothetical protein RSE12_05055 [Fuscovulum sp.]|nr:MAG: hypothetical protein RSE12_05055 [Fuscovulum sp.]
MRSTTATVTFRNSFRLPGHDRDFPSGSYDVLREDERLDGLTFEAFRRVATYLRVRGRGVQAGQTELLPITEKDLDAALLADRGLPETLIPNDAPKMEDPA